MTSTRFAWGWLPLVSLAALLLGQGGARAENAARARELFQEGTTYFDVGQFDKAIDAWQRGYKEKPDPGFLYNIGQAYRLSGDPHKAIFFYRGFLRNSPKAPNRAEIEQKIAALQKQIEQDAARGATAPPASPPPGAPPPASAAPGATTSPPVGAMLESPPPAAPPGPAPPVMAEVPPAPLAPPAVVAIAPGATEQIAATPAAPPPAAPRAPGRAGLGVALGIDSWGKGLHGSAQPSFAFALTGGYTFWGAPERRLAFGIHGIVSFSFLAESPQNMPPWKETFWSFIAEPSLRYRYGRLSLSAGVGIGIIALGGLREQSALLQPDAGKTTTVTGTQSLLVVRPALGVDLVITGGLAATLTLAFPYSPKPQTYFYAPIARTELLLGLAYRF
ncbi:MAG TPA: tetratricopeptide repeat protein [Polyangia bacterium]|nr:tetratricopeptide repeat protein [Polyangia bacterium]